MLWKSRPSPEGMKPSICIKAADAVKETVNITGDMRYCTKMRVLMAALSCPPISTCTMMLLAVGVSETIRATSHLPFEAGPVLRRDKTKTQNATKAG